MRAVRPGGLVLVLVVAGCLDAPPGGTGGRDAGGGGDGGASGDAAPGAARAVSGTFRHFCAVVDGGAWCWGDNGAGQLGDGSKTPRSQAVQVLRAEGTPLEGVVEVAPGEKHTCALLADQTVVCWGSNAVGQLGSGVDDDLEYPFAVTAVANLTDAVEITAGGDHTCARLTSGAVYCWGRGVSGELGDDTLDDRPGIQQPVVKEGLTLQASRVTAGRYHTCFIDDGDHVACTGWNEDGQSGQRTGEPPEEACGYSNADEVSRETGAQLGPASDVASGFRHTCAIVDQAVYCFGHARCGELGDDDPTSCGATPADDGSCLETALRLYPVGALLPPSCTPERVAAGYSHTCALCADRSVQCWGSGARGRLGQGDVVEHAAPVEVMDLGPAVAVAAGAESSCATVDDGTIFCWGSAEYGQLGDGSGPEPGNTTIFQTTPREVLGLPPP